MPEKRMALRARHLKNMASVNGKLICAGGLPDDEGRMKGSALVVNFASLDLPEEYLCTEPYTLGHVREEVEVEPVKAVIVGGGKVGK